MSDQRIMHQVVAVNHAADGLTVEYGPGELHEPDSLPEGVGYRAVVADDVARQVAPAHARPEPATPPAAAKTETATPPATAAPEPKSPAYRK